MNIRISPSTTARRRRRLGNALGVGILVVAVIATVAVAQSVAAASAGRPPFPGAASPVVTPALSALTDADGFIVESDAVSVFDERPGVSGLDPDLLAAVRAAAIAAENDGVRMQVNSGWRSPAYQAALLADAVERYGSAEEAARWVAIPERSAHVSGDAVDLGPVAAQDWLARHGAAFGLCPIYANEPWHFELRPAAVTNGCPLMYEDPTVDPRTQR